MLDLLERDAIRLQIFGGFHLGPRHSWHIHNPLHLPFRRCSRLDSGLLPDLAATDLLPRRPQHHQRDNQPLHHQHESASRRKSHPMQEKMYSSAYMILEIVVQTFLCNLAFVILGEIFAFMSIVNVNSLVSYGTLHLLFIFLWQRASFNPEEMTRFCCFPCIMPMKYLPWCFFALLVLFNPDLFIIIACLLGYLQHMILKRSLLQLPLSFYNKLESILPASVKQSPGFVSIRSV